MLNWIKRFVAPQAFKIEGLYMGPEDIRITIKGRSRYILPEDVSLTLRQIADAIDARGGF